MLFATVYVLVCITKEIDCCRQLLLVNSECKNKSIVSAAGNYRVSFRRKNGNNNNGGDTDKEDLIVSDLRSLPLLIYIGSYALAKKQHEGELRHGIHGRCLHRKLPHGRRHAGAARLRSQCWWNVL